MKEKNIIRKGTVIKKCITCLLIATMVVCNTAAGLCDSRGSFSTSLASSFDYSAKEWFSSSLKRATLSFILFFEYGLMEDAAEIDLLSPSYVAKDGLCLYIFAKTDEGALALVYKPSGEGEVAYGIIGEYDKKALVSFLEDNDYDYYKNDIEDMVKVAKKIITSDE